jgi:HEAT repeat protein
LLIACLGDEHDSVSRSAAETLGNLRDCRAVPGLVILLTDTTPLRPDKQLCDIVAKALEAIGTRQALAAVKAWQTDKANFNPSAFLAKWSNERRW